MNKRELGKIGEDIAKKYLEKNGYQILKENFWCRYGEVDLIANDIDYLVFIEVKLSTTNYFSSPCERVDYRKQEHLKRVARYYLSKYQLETNFRFDVVEIANYKKREDINLIKNAF